MNAIVIPTKRIILRIGLVHFTHSKLDSLSYFSPSTGSHLPHMMSVYPLFTVNRIQACGVVASKTRFGIRTLQNHRGVRSFSPVARLYIEHISSFTKRVIKSLVSLGRVPEKRETFRTTEHSLILANVLPWLAKPEVC